MKHARWLEMIGGLKSLRFSSMNRLGASAHIYTIVPQRTTLQNTVLLYFHFVKYVQYDTRSLTICCLVLASICMPLDVDLYNLLGVQSVADVLRGVANYGWCMWLGKLKWFGHLERKCVDDCIWVSACRMWWPVTEVRCAGRGMIKVLRGV